MQVPLEMRSVWRQRLRWARGGHLFVLDRTSVFWRNQPHISLWQKMGYMCGFVSSLVDVWAQPVRCRAPATIELLHAPSG